MLQSKTEIVKGFKEMDVPYTFMQIEENSKNLVIFLPGMGYTVNSPVFHYSKDVFLHKSFDVLKVDYRYNDTAYDEFNMEEFDEAVQYDARIVIDHVLKNRAYENFYLVGKSIGTLAMTSELKREIFHNAKAVWLTPLLNTDAVYKAIVNSHHQGLCIIGDSDHQYIEERYRQILRNQNIESHLYPNVNHGLDDVNDTLASINVLKSIITAIKNFERA